MLAFRRERQFVKCLHKLISALLVKRSLPRYYDTTVLNRLCLILQDSCGGCPFSHQRISPVIYFMLLESPLKWWVTSASCHPHTTVETQSTTIVIFCLVLVAAHIQWSLAVNARVNFSPPGTLMTCESLCSHSYSAARVQTPATWPTDCF